MMDQTSSHLFCLGLIFKESIGISSFGCCTAKRSVDEVKFSTSIIYTPHTNHSIV